MVSLNKSDLVIPQPADAAAAAIAQRIAIAQTTASFAPTVVGAFTHQTTAVETTIGTTTNFPLITTTMNTSDVAAAVVGLSDQSIQNRLLINRVVYILESNGMTS